MVRYEGIEKVDARFMMATDGLRDPREHRRRIKLNPRINQNLKQARINIEPDSRSKTSSV